MGLMRKSSGARRSSIEELSEQEDVESGKREMHLFESQESKRCACLRLSIAWH